MPIPVKPNSTVSVNVDYVGGDDDIYFLNENPSNYQYAWQLSNVNKSDISAKQRLTGSPASIEFNSGDDLLFRGLSQSTIGDTGFPCLVRNGTEGDSRSIITRIKLKRTP